MSEHLPDERLISGAVIAAEIWFEVGELVGVKTFGRDAAPEPGCVSFQWGVKPGRDVALEGPAMALSGLAGSLQVTSQRERTERLGLFRREQESYSIGINLFEPEADRFLSLMASGLRPRTLLLEFDIEVVQWFECENYWDDVRYPYVNIHEYRIEWTR